MVETITKLNKKCPFLQDICTGEMCPIWVTMRRAGLGRVETTGMCSLPAIVILTTEVIGLLQRQQQQPIRLPPGLVVKG